MSKKRISILLVFAILLGVVFIVSYSYALFESNIEGEVETHPAKWHIKVNNTMISTGVTNEFTINNINYTQTDSNVRSGKFAPGIEGYYDLIIDPTDTEVSIKYTIIIEDFESENLKIDHLQLLSGNGTLTEDGEGNYVGIIPLGSTVTENIRIFLVWDNLDTDEANAADSLMGTAENPDVDIPVTIQFIQYLGE
jgi:hypothetical protein